MDVHSIRRANLLALFKAYVEAHLAEDVTASVSGLDRAFALEIQVHNTAFSGMKTGSRQIGPAVARQIESTLKKPKDWLDTDHGHSADTPEKAELAFAKLARRAFSRATADQRVEMTQAFQRILSKAE